jgi:hypothetical protein
MLLHADLLQDFQDFAEVGFGFAGELDATA